MSAVTNVYRNVRGLRTAIKDVGRLRTIATVLGKHGFGWLVTRMELTEVIGLRGLMTYTDENRTPISVAERFRLALEELGPTFVKLGQILSTRSDLLPMEFIDELEHLQDRVPPMPWEDVEAQIKDELGGSTDTLFASFEHEPLASASIAQVHRGTLADGTEVVVKVRRRGIADLVERDLSILHFMAARAEDLVPELQLIDPVGIIKEFDRALRRELDLGHERGSVEKFQENFADFEGVHIPDTHRELCSEAILTMELIRGVKVTEAPTKLGVDPYVVAPRMLQALFKMIFEDGLFHGDLHPGNIFIQEDGTISLIDFGLVGRLLPRQREDILDLLVGINKEDYELVARVFFDLGVKMPGVEYNFVDFENDVVDVMERYVAGKTLDEIDVQGFFAELVNGAIKHRIKMPPTYTMVFKALMTIEGIGKQLAPEVNLIEESKPFVREMMLQRYSPERIFHEAVDTLTSAGRFLQRFTQSAPRLLSAMEQGRFAVRVEAEKLSELVIEQRKASRRQMRAIVFGACILVAATVHDAAGPEVLGMHLGAFLALGGAALAGVPLFIDLFRR